MYETKYDEIIEDRRLYAYINDLQQELQRKDNIINGIKKEINEQLEEYEKGKEKYKNYGNLEDYAKGLRSAYISILDKMKELENET